MAKIDKRLGRVIRHTVEGVSGIPIGYKSLKSYIATLELYASQWGDESSKSEIERIKKAKEAR